MSVETSFEIRATRIKSALEDDESFYWFYVSLHLEQKADADMSLSQLELVEYHLLDGSFPDPDIRISNPRNGFEYRFWLYGFIRASADLVTKSGRVFRLPSTKLQWDFTADELKRNGKRELSW